jgi:hypothetical protein
LTTSDLGLAGLILEAVAGDRLGRVRATVRENYARSLYYLDGRLADAMIEAGQEKQDD